MFLKKILDNNAHRVPLIADMFLYSYKARKVENSLLSNFRMHS